MRIAVLMLGVLAAFATSASAARDQNYGVVPDQLIAIGAKYLSKTEVVRLLTDRTEIWDTGGKAFYGRGGKLSLRFRTGERVDGSWQVSGNGTMCTKASVAISGSNYCHRYISHKGRIYYVWRGKVAEIHKTREGKVF